MKNIITILIMIVAINVVNAQAAILEWVKGIGGSDWDIGNSITTDNNGNVYTTGHFNNSIDFDPSSNTTILTESGPAADAFITKFDPSGNMIWATSFIGNEHEYGWRIITDAQANIFVLGMFNGTTDFDTSISPITRRTTNGDWDIFIAKLDANGNLLWVKTFGGTGEDYGRDIRLDNNGNIYATGFFTSTTDFNPSPTGNLIATPVGDKDAFLLKLDNAGNFVWVKTIGSSDDDRGDAVSTDAYGNPYLVGQFKSNVGTPYNLTYTNGLHDVFMIKFDPSGNIIWSKSTGNGDDGVSAIYVDGSGNLFHTGDFFETADFDPSATGTHFETITGSSGWDAYVSKIDPLGNLAWVTTMGGIDNESGYAISQDGQGNTYVTGDFKGTAKFGTTTLTSDGSSDIFLVKLDQSGTVIWAKSIGGSQQDYASSIACFSSSIYITGYFKGTSYFNIGGSPANLQEAGEGDIFIAKYDQTTTSFNEALSNSAIELSPNPAKTQLTINTNGIVIEQANVYNSTGALVMASALSNNQLSIAHLPNGIYFLEVKTNEGIGSKRFVKM